MESSGKSNHKTTKHVIAKDTGHLWESIGALSLWKERLNDIRRKPGNYTLNGIHDWANRRTADLNGRNDSGNAEPGHPTLSYAGTESEIAKIKQRVIRAAQHFAKYRGTAFQDGRTENEDRTFGKRKSAMAEIGTEAEQRKQFITETEHRIAELEQQIEKGRDIDERIQRIKERRTVGRASALTEEIQEELEQKDQLIVELKTQLNESLILNEKLNKENRAGNIQALKNDLKLADRALRNEKEKLRSANVMIGECQIKYAV